MPKIRYNPRFRVGEKVTICCGGKFIDTYVTGVHIYDLKYQDIFYKYDLEIGITIEQDKLYRAD